MPTPTWPSNQSWLMMLPSLSVPLPGDLLSSRHPCSKTGSPQQIVMPSICWLGYWMRRRLLGSQELQKGFATSLVRNLYHYSRKNYLIVIERKHLALPNCQRYQYDSSLESYLSCPVSYLSSTRNNIILDSLATEHNQLVYFASGQAIWS